MFDDDSASEGCGCCDVVCQSVNVLMFSTPLVLSALGSSQESEAPSSSTLFKVSVHHHIVDRHFVEPNF